MTLWNFFHFLIYFIYKCKNDSSKIFFQNESIHKDPCRAISYQGELMVSLKFVPCFRSNFQSDSKKSSKSKKSSESSHGGSLLLLIREAKNLTTKGGKMPDSYCKWYFHILFLNSLCK